MCASIRDLFDQYFIQISQFAQNAFKRKEHPNKSLAILAMCAMNAASAAGCFFFVRFFLSNSYETIRLVNCVRVFVMNGFDFLEFCIDFAVNKYIVSPI